MKKLISNLIFLFVLLGCARVQTLNTKEHRYSEKPRHIVWIQLAGFSEEHLPLLRFNKIDVNYRTEFEKFDCVGRMWAYNLFQLRPSAASSFISQLSGSKNLKRQCADYAQSSVFARLSPNYSVAAILENAALASEKIDQTKECSEFKIFNPDEVQSYLMAAAPLGSQVKSFHYQDANLEKVPGAFFDKSCIRGECYSSLSSNFKTIWSQLLKDQKPTFMLVRDFSYLRAIEKKDISLMKQSLQEIENILQNLSAMNNTGVLVVVSGAGAIPLEFPMEGKEWANYEKSTKGILFKNQTLMSPIFSKGPSAENFCGLFEESEVASRLLYHGPRKKFNWDNLNPFN